MKVLINYYVLQVNLLLDCPHSSEVKEQALCIVGNIASATISPDYIMEDESILKKLLEFVVSNTSFRYIMQICLRVLVCCFSLYS